MSHPLPERTSAHAPPALPPVRRLAPLRGHDDPDRGAEPRRRARRRLYRRGLALADVFAATASIALAVAQTGEVRAAWMLVPVPWMLVINKWRGLYDRDEVLLNKSTLDETPTLMHSAALFTIGAWLWHDWFSASSLGARDVLELWVATVLLLVGGRVLARWWVGRLCPPERCLALGDGAAIDLIARKLADGGVRAEVTARIAFDRPAPDVTGDPIRAAIERLGIERVILAPISTDAWETLNLVRIARSAGVPVTVFPRLFEVVGSAVRFDHVSGLTLIGVPRFGLRRSAHVTKRAFDFAGSSLALAALAPLMALIAAAIKLDSKGPVLFGQTRVGRDGEPFRIYKFRSMVSDAEAHKQALRHLNETEGLYKIAADPRITRVGRLLRMTCLDELPQLINVWRGEMSLVGPRPLVLDEDVRIEGYDRIRLHLMPGMTGHWQILGAARVPLAEMVAIDYLYVSNWSLWTDIKILLRTVPYVLGRNGL